MAHQPHKIKSSDGQYIVRLYDHFDGWLHPSFKGTWIQCLEYWNNKTKKGTVLAEPSAYKDYWWIFPAKTKMLDTPQARGR